ncbi:MAG: 3-isopropylmalate dehydratase [Gammaproteobacteria bacterium]|nr:3-isopropylmalate dehydratase [Gammaproteobacteria bacterium]MYF62314.1 3-isopropylmalate dehydratase [Gammaproteobacteria bacterium]MYI22896.1 3-isopropylmalate dehydratase [Gammaproteobacteria bacterium]
MAGDLLTRPTPKRPDALDVRGRVLYLADDTDLVRAQLYEGLDLELSEELRDRLRDQISTDEITPAYICFFYDETLGEFPYLGLRTTNTESGAEEYPVGRASVRDGGFVCSVAGRRRGKGSSREQSPYAELMAGIRVVVSESIERIYNENCQNLGVLTTTDFGVAERIARGEPLRLEEFTRGKDDITRQIIEYGGLFEFNVARMQGRATVPVARSSARPMTLAEKIFARHWVVDPADGTVGVDAVTPGEAGFFRTDIRFSHEYVTPMAAIFFEQKMGPEGRVRDPDSVLFFRDHLTFLHKAMSQERIEEGLLEVANQLEVKQREFAEKQGIRLYGEQMGHRMGSVAICHSKILEDYAEPGMLIIGSDSHTPHAGAIGALAFGVGTTAIFNSWITRDVRVQVPPSFKVVISGTPAEGVTAKDYMLEILRHPYIRDGHAIGQIIEYAGPAVEALPVDERATMTNMAAEVGAFTGLVAADEESVEYLVAERGMDRARAEALARDMHSDPGANYVRVIEIEASAIQPMAALPNDPGNGVPLDDLEAERIRIDIAYAGSCTAGKKEDMDMYARVFREMHDRWGLGVHPDVECFVQCGSTDVREYCRKRGYLDLFRRIGATFIEPGCGACINAGPGVTRRPDEVSISSQNRNFPGRSGPGQLYLASPYSVAASAVAGYVTAWKPGARPRPVEMTRRLAG